MGNSSSSHHRKHHHHDDQRRPDNRYASHSGPLPRPAHSAPAGPAYSGPAHSGPAYSGPASPGAACQHHSGGVSSSSGGGGGGESYSRSSSFGYSRALQQKYGIIPDTFRSIAQVRGRRLDRQVIFGAGCIWTSSFEAPQRLKSRSFGYPRALQQQYGIIPDTFRSIAQVRWPRGVCVDRLHDLCPMRGSFSSSSTRDTLACPCHVTSSLFLSPFPTILLAVSVCSVCHSPPSLTLSPLTRPLGVCRVTVSPFHLSPACPCALPRVPPAGAGEAAGGGVGVAVCSISPSSTPRFSPSRPPPVCASPPCAGGGVGVACRSTCCVCPSLSLPTSLPSVPLFSIHPSCGRLQVQEKLREVGLESSNLIVAVDFTKSNEWTGESWVLFPHSAPFSLPHSTSPHLPPPISLLPPPTSSRPPSFPGKQSFNGPSLHAIAPGMVNPYEQAIDIIDQTLNPSLLPSLPVIRPSHFRCTPGKQSFNGRSLHAIAPGASNPYEQAIDIIGQTLNPSLLPSLPVIRPSHFRCTPGKQSFNGRSLHAIAPGASNPYEQAIDIIGQTLSAFDEDNLIPCYGFGDGMFCPLSLLLPSLSPFSPSLPFSTSALRLR
ncbi:unnamed protein product [Closterium sp. NIES-54]